MADTTYTVPIEIKWLRNIIKDSETLTKYEIVGPPLPLKVKHHPSIIGIYKVIILNKNSNNENFDPFAEGGWQNQ